MSPTTQHEIPRTSVIVVGGGPVGLSAALLLQRHGVDCLVLERDRIPSTHPKARGMRARTMELFTQWGIAEQMRRAALPDKANRFIYCDSLAGEEIARSPEAHHDPDVSLVGPCRLSQDTAHRVLLETVTALGIEVRMETAVRAVQDQGDRVVVTTQSGEQVAADYVIAADGIASTVRRLLGIEMEGQPVLGYGQSIYWHGDLRPWTEDRMCIQFMTGHRAGRPASVAPVDGHHRWITMVMQPPSEQRPEPPSIAEAVAIVNRAVGVDVAAEIIDITTWRISALVAEHWGVGRIFLAGDAAHSFPPTGGFGMNTGVQDVHNLVWKIALVLRGQADDTLLDSYEVERIEIARSNAAWSVANSDRFRNIGKAIAADDRDTLARLLEDQRGHVDATDQDLGFGYARGALSGHDELTALSPLRHARVGHRFPQTTLVVDGEKRSSTTELDEAFTVVATDPTAWTDAVAELRANGLHVVMADGPEPAVGSGGVALVRPDGIVAWLPRDAAAATTTGLLAAVHQILRDT